MHLIFIKCLFYLFPIQTLCNNHCNIYFCTQQIRMYTSERLSYRIVHILFSLFDCCCTMFCIASFEISSKKAREGEGEENCMAHIIIEVMQLLIMKNDVLFLFDALYCSQFFGWRTHHAILLL